ncbi:MAG: DUF3109 family protein [Bacteroidales bacterium]
MKKRSFIFEIENCLVSSEILTEYFVCDYESCKGCCCIIGDSGAPMDKNEEDAFREEFENYKEYMTVEGVEVIKKQGFGVIDRDGDLVTPLVNNEECAYTSFDEQMNCLCAVDKAHYCGKSKFKKPISCWLYPIRVSTFSNGMQALNLHRWVICSDAFEKGKKEKVPVYKFLREPIIHKFGPEFYSALEEAARSLEAME